MEYSWIKIGNRREGKMSKRRQDYWTSDEDQLLTETVLQYIREGKTQLEAFKIVGEKLSRTSAACGFRWNKTLRHQHAEEIALAKKSKKDQHEKNGEKQVIQHELPNTIEQAISLLLHYKEQSEQQPMIHTLQEKINQLEEENERMKMLLSRYDEAWREINNIWQWTKKIELNTTNHIHHEKTD